MVISSLVIESMPNETERVSEELARVGGVEVVQTLDWKTVVVIEAPSIEESHRIAGDFVKIDGVLNINLVYVNFEDDPYLSTHRRAS